MLFVDVVFLLGLMSATVGVVKRKQGSGMWFLAGGIALMAISFFILGYPDFKAGFLEALGD
jgi:hypothetical protein